MSGRRPTEAVLRTALSIDEAAASLGVSRDSFERVVLPEIRSARIGRRRVIAPAELQRWLERHQACVLDDLRGRS